MIYPNIYTKIFVIAISVIIKTQTLTTKYTGFSVNKFSLIMKNITYMNNNNNAKNNNT